MTAAEIEQALLRCLQQLPDLHQRVVLALTAWRTQEADEERKAAEVYLVLKAKEPTTQEALKKLTLLDPAVYAARLDTIAAESAYRAAGGQLQVVERQYDALRSLLGMQRALVEQQVELQTP